MNHDEGFRVCDRLVEVRKAAGKTQKEVAAAIGVPERTYQKHEAGEQLPRLPVIVALARLYGVSTDYLLGLKDTP